MTDFKLQNGALKLNGSVYGPAGAPNVVCLHGISNSRDTWQETVAHLNGRFRVWTLDFRGHGDSDRANRYLIQDYASDAAALLEMINKPTLVIGHSLGGMVAAFLAQQPHPQIRAVLLEDPPIYLNEVDEWNKTVLATAFPILRDKQCDMQRRGASFDEFIEFASNSPCILGGVVADHQRQRHLDSNGSALMRHDPETWKPALDMNMLAAVDSKQPLKVPTLLLQADHKLGPAFLAGHEQRFIATNPLAQVITYAGAPHRIHATLSQESRFLSDVDKFIAQHSN
ncbi:MAG: pimeloyl-ACP methyl ester carboxylesterase [Cryomorphaceae bacterium]